MEVLNGVVGDWRLADNEFMASFTLPSEKLEALKRKHPFPREHRIQFDEAAHTYTIDGRIVVPRSVTALVHKFSTPFDARACVEQMRARDTWEWRQYQFMRVDGTPMSTEEIVQMWEANGLVQRSRGTLLHYHVEQFLNGASLEDPHSPEFKQFLQIYELVLSKEFEVYRTEISMFHCGLRVAGQADCLCRDRNGDIVIWDWKRSKEIREDSKQQMLPPLQHLPDTNYWAYALQLNLYKYVLSSEYDMRVSRMILGVVHPMRAKPFCIELPWLDAEVALIVAHEGGRTPMPGPNAEF